MRASTFSGVAALIAAHTPGIDLPLAVPTRARKIAVVGAGIAGLVAAYELVKSGHDVTVFEARLRPGGRIHTLRDEFSDGLHAEAGAIDFGDAYTLLQRYIREFGLHTTEEGATEKTAAPSDVFFLNGQRLPVASGNEPMWPFALTPEERKLGRRGLWKKYVEPLAAHTGDPAARSWPGSAAQELDASTLEQHLRKQGVSEAAISVLRMSFLGEDYDHVSALQDLIWQPFIDSNKAWMQIRGGNDLLPKAFAEKLGSRMHYGAVLRKLSQDGKKVRLSISSGESVTEFSADRAVVAIPFSVLRNIEMDGSIRPSKREVISKVRYESASHIFLQSKSRFWSKQGLSGFASTDLPIRTVLNYTDAQPGPRAILGTEMEGKHSRMVSGMSADERIRWCLENVTKIFPEMAENFERGASVQWDLEPWSLGAAAYFAPGEMTSMYPHVATAEGRIHFAGEHTSLLYFMEGAAQSGMRAANEINSAS